MVSGDGEFVSNSVFLCIFFRVSAVFIIPFTNTYTKTPRPSPGEDMAFCH